MDRRAPPSSLIACVFAWLLLVVCSSSRADAGADDGLHQQVRRFALEGAGAAATAGSPRIEVEVGALDARLRLAPCEQVEPYLPANTRLWGRTRVGVRCVKGPSRWNVFLPLIVKVYGQALVAARALPARAVIGEGDLIRAEVDLAEDPSAAVGRADLVLGRTLARPVAVGASLRQSHLLARQWFAAGDTVKVVALGGGFRVSGEAQALTRGLEGEPARVRTESGRVLSGMPVGERELEVRM